MTSALQEWEDHYRPLLGRRLMSLSFMPLTSSDTPQVVEALKTSPIWFSGAVRLDFEGADPTYLTWTAALDGYQLAPFADITPQWHSFTLDTIHASFEGPWEDLRDRMLEGVGVFTMPDIPDQSAVAAEFRLSSEGAATRSLWIGTSHEDQPCDGDDLIVSVDTAPTGSEPLVGLGLVQ